MKHGLADSHSGINDGDTGIVQQGHLLQIVKTMQEGDLKELIKKQQLSFVIRNSLMDDHFVTAQRSVICRGMK